MAAFSVSAYSSGYYRAGQKPFNPLLGETYECIREDKGWRFVAEQVRIQFYNLHGSQPHEFELKKNKWTDYVRTVPTLRRVSTGQNEVQIFSLTSFDILLR